MEDLIFYTKLKADFFHHSIEFQRSQSRSPLARTDADTTAFNQQRIQQLGAQAREALGLACGLANDALPPSHPLRLHLALSVGHFLHRIMGADDAAFETCNQAFREGMEELNESAAAGDTEMFQEAAAALKQLTALMEELPAGEATEDEEDELVKRVKEVTADLES